MTKEKVLTFCKEYYELTKKYDMHIEGYELGISKGEDDLTNTVMCDGGTYKLLTGEQIHPPLNLSTEQERKEQWQKYVEWCKPFGGVS